MAEKDKQIKTLTDSISKLRGDVVNEKEKAVDAKEKAADAKEKAADAKAEAAERAKAEAEKAKADATAKQSESKPANVANARQDVIAILGKASKFQKAKDRESLRVDAINKLNNLTSMDAAHKSDYNWCITELKKPITLKDNGRGQYTACINKLKAIK